jgi:murein DD-endopeptidase MepM/ murein hydrolase activator NlpD
LRRRLHIVALLTTLVLVMSGSQAGAHEGARSSVRSALLERQSVVERARDIRRLEASLAEDVRRRIDRLARLRQTGMIGIGASEADRRSATIAVTPELLSTARDRLRTLKRWLDTRVRALHHRYGAIQRWLDTAGVFRVCPVPDYTQVYDNFGDVVRIPHVPVHVHQGDDVSAPAGSPIVAPFDGYASSSRSKLGGLEIRVFGDAGYIYNAHAAGIAQLGWVQAGTVVGSVGVSGDATGPHDHIEWHPNDGLAVDPYALLAAACLPSAG